MKYQCLNNIGIIEKFLFYHKTEYDYDAVAGKKDMLPNATDRRGANTGKTGEWSWPDRGKDKFLSSEKRLQETVFKTLLDGKEIKRSQNSLIFHFLVKNTTAVKSLFANYLL